MAIDLFQLLAHAIGFIILVALLKRFAWGPLLGVLDQRRRQIASGLDDIVRAKQEMGALKAQYEQELARIEESARQKLVEAVNQGRRLATEIEEEARARAQLELLKTKETLALEVTKAKTVLRDQIVTLAVEAAEKLLRGRLDETKDRALVEQFIAELDGKTKA
jgi:F-type H+-transporting ATPase subunit b